MHVGAARTQAAVAFEQASFKISSYDDHLLGEDNSGRSYSMVDRLGELGVSKAVADSDLERGGAGQSQHMQQFFQEVGIVKHKIAAIRRNVNVISSVSAHRPLLVRQQHELTPAACSCIRRR